MKQLQRPKKQSSIITHTREDLARNFFWGSNAGILKPDDPSENVSKNIVGPWRLQEGSKRNEVFLEEEDLDTSCLEEERKAILEKQKRLRGILAMLRSRNQKSKNKLLELVSNLHGSSKN
jgi:hypothetical protein